MQIIYEFDSAVKVKQEAEAFWKLWQEGTSNLRSKVALERRKFTAYNNLIANFASKPEY